MKIAVDVISVDKSTYADTGWDLDVVVTIGDQTIDAGVTLVPSQYDGRPCIDHDGWCCDTLRHALYALPDETTARLVEVIIAQMGSACIY